MPIYYIYVINNIYILFAEDMYSIICWHSEQYFLSNVEQVVIGITFFIEQY